jgi:Cu(I)/Ag(I) efflux system membrane protein CusA/SilA
MVRGRGYLKSIDDIAPCRSGRRARHAVRVGDVARVGWARSSPWRAELDGKGEVVGGIVVMRFGENALRVIERVKGEAAGVQDALPAACAIVPTYDRSGSSTSRSPRCGAR